MHLCIAVGESIRRSIGPKGNQPVNQRITHAVSFSLIVNQSNDNQSSINPSADQWVNQSINQSPVSHTGNVPCSAMMSWLVVLHICLSHSATAAPSVPASFGRECAGRGAAVLRCRGREPIAWWPPTCRLRRWHDWLRGKGMHEIDRESVWYMSQYCREPCSWAFTCTVDIRGIGVVWPRHTSLDIHNPFG